MGDGNGRDSAGSGDRLESWKEIAAYLGRDVSTVQRWEKRAGLPVHRHARAPLGGVYAYREELELWRRSDGEGADAPPPVAPAREPGPGTSSSRREAARWQMPVVVVLVIAVAGALGIWSARRGGAESAGAIPFTQDDYVLITRFENYTGEPLFDDGTLESVLRLGLSASTYLQPVPPERVEDALRLMQQPVDTPIDRALGREVALRDGGIRAVLAGSIEGAAGEYVLTLQIVSPGDGRVLGSQQADARDEAGIVAAIRQQAGWARERLGEAAPLVEASTQRLQQVTTPSLRALQLYSRGYDLQRRRGDAALPAAEQLHKLAVEEDPSFAMAHIMLAWAVRNQGRPPADYLPHAEQALELSGDSAERDRLFIEASYLTLTGDVEAARGRYEALLELEPDHVYAMNNMINSYRSLGQRPPVEWAVRLAVQRPNDARSQRGAMTALAQAGDLERATAFFERARLLIDELGSPAERAHVVFFPTFTAWQSGDPRQTLSTLESVDVLDERPDAEPAYLAAAVTYYLALGRIDAARATLDRIPRTAGNNLRFYETLIASALQNRSELGRIWDDVDDGPWVYWRALGGLPPDADALAAAPVGHRRLAEGERAFQRGEWDEAAALLQEGLEWLLDPDRDGNAALWPAVYTASESLATAWAKLGDAERVLLTLERAAAQDPLFSGTLLGAHEWQRVRARLAREYRALGREEDALAIEDDIIALLALADANHPIVREIREARAGASADQSNQSR